MGRPFVSNGLGGAAFHGVRAKVYLLLGFWLAMHVRRLKIIMPTEKGGSGIPALVTINAGVIHVEAAL